MGTCRESIASHRDVHFDADISSFFPPVSLFDIQPLGGVLQQGLIGYITMGVNMSASYEAKWTPNSGRGSA